MTTESESTLYYSKIEKLIQFFRKYCSDADKESIFVKVGIRVRVRDIEGTLSFVL
jgi:hypothetical protein